MYYLVFKDFGRFFAGMDREGLCGSCEPGDAVLFDSLVEASAMMVALSLFLDEDDIFSISKKVSK